MNPELIECLKSFIRSKRLTSEWNIFRDNWFNKFSSESANESLIYNNQAQQVCDYCGDAHPENDTVIVCTECRLKIGF